MSNQDFDRRDWFIGHRHTVAANSWASWIGWTLEAVGQTVWLDLWDTRPGSRVERYMAIGLQNSDRFLAVMTRDFDDGAFASLERDIVLHSDPTGDRAALVPVRVEALASSVLLSTHVTVDLVDHAEQEARERLLGLLSPVTILRPRIRVSHLSKPRVAPKFPPQAPKAASGGLRIVTDHGLGLEPRDPDLDELHSWLARSDLFKADVATTAILCGDGASIEPHTLAAVNEAWTSATSGRQGLERQSQLASSLSGSFLDFSEAVGWAENGQWRVYKDLTFSPDAPEGHLPSLHDESLGVWKERREEVLDVMLSAEYTTIRLQRGASP